MTAFSQDNLPDHIAQRIAELSPAQRQLLEQRLAQLAAEKAARATVQPRTAPGPYPTTYAQRSLWFLDQLDPGTPVYNSTTKTWRLQGALDLPAVQRSLDTIVARHESLRTTFAVQDGEPVQVINPPSAVPMALHDLSHLAAAGQDEQVEHLLREAALYHFDLSRDLMLHGHLIRLADHDHILAIAQHHIASDFWSSSILEQELGACYAAYVEGQTPALPELPVQYADYAIWERRQLAQEEWLRPKVEFWRQRLAGAPPLQLPTDRVRPPTQTHRGDHLSHTAPAELLAALGNLTRSVQATLFSGILALFKTVLFRYTHQDDIVIGSLLANRKVPQVENLIGYFINPIVLRSQLSPRMTFRELIEYERQVLYEAMSHDLPFEKLVEVVRPERDASRHPVFQVVLNYTNVTRKPFQFPGLRTTPMRIRRGLAEFDLLMAVNTRGQHLSFDASFDRDVFDQRTIAQFLRHMGQLLAAAVREPNRPISELPLLQEDERRQVLVAWNRTQQDFPLHRTFPELFAEQAARSPDRVAATDGAGEITYADLERRADRFAGALLARGLQPEGVVCLLAARNIDFLVAMLGTFKAGGVYLPLDPRSPAPRLAQMLAQAGKQALVIGSADFMDTLRAACASLGETAPTPLALPTLLAEQPSTSTSTSTSASTSTSTSPAQLAYIIFTSGSTGLPKGAMVEHRGMLNHLFAKVVDLGLTEADVVAQNAPQSFDISVWQFLAGLLVGGRVHIFADDVAYDPAALLEQVAAQGITVFEAVPSMLQAMLDSAELHGHGSRIHAPTALRWLIPTGEAFPPELSRRWFARYPHLPQLNAYGPTECSDDVTHYVLREPLPETEATMPIGRPIANMTAYILDQNLEPAPVGVSGDLYIGGVGVGRGYLNDPARTAEVFLPDPFSSQPGARMYKTGDLARWLPDGNIAFLGRSDFQVKVRGFRIELGEIEAVLRRHEAVHEAVVIARNTSDGDQRLIAYVTPEASAPDASGRKPSAPSTTALRAYLRDRLPDYMVPSAVVTLEALPLTPHGKVDRNALPTPDLQPDGGDRVGPRTALEAQIAAVWTQVLGAARLDVTRNFFELGGHSLLAARLVYSLRQELGLDLPLHAFFQDPTIAGLAARLANGDEAHPGMSWGYLLPIQPRGARPPLFLLAGGGGGEPEYLEVYAGLIHRLGADQPVYGFQATGLDQDAAAVEQMAREYVAEMRQVQPHGPYYLAGECVGGKLALEMARQLQAEGETIGALVMMNTVPHGLARHASIAGASPLRALRRRVLELRRLSPEQRGQRLRQMLSNAAAVLLPLTAQQRQSRDVRAARYGYMACLRNYTPQPYQGAVTLFMTADLRGRGLHEGWRAFVEGDLTIEATPGVHATYLGDHVAETAAMLARALGTGNGQARMRDADGTDDMDGMD